MPPKENFNLGIDDQAFWAMATMSAAESKFPDPPSDQPQWLALSEAVFNTQAKRWDTQHCGGGLRWQIIPFNVGYDYKNTISNGCFFHLAARLARYTGNKTYVEWAERTWKWSVDIGFIDVNTWKVIDGAEMSTNCTTYRQFQWSYNVAIYLSGAAFLWNVTENPIWKERLEGLMK